MTKKIVFAGTPDFAAHHLQALLAAQLPISAVYTQPDRPAGRGRKLTPSPVKKIALEAGIDVYQPESLKDPASQSVLRDLAPDIFVVVAYGLLLPQAVLDIPTVACINVHASLLPRWRGAAPIQRAIEAGDSTSGVTIMKMALGLDTGDMLIKTPCPILNTETGGSLHDKLAEAGSQSLITFLRDPESFLAKAETQDDSQANYASKLSKQEAQIDWTQTAQDIDRQVRAFNPWPVSYCLLNDERVRIWDAEPLAQPHDQAPGTLVDISKQGLLIATGEGCLRLQRLQLSGQKAMSVQDLLNGNKLSLNVGQKFQ